MEWKVTVKPKVGHGDFPSITELPDLHSVGIDLAYIVSQLEDDIESITIERTK